MAEADVRTPDTTLRLTRTLAAPRERVFRAFTDPEELIAWFGPSDDFKIPSAEVDLRVGGRYRIDLLDPSGNRLSVGGSYREILRPERLVFTWQWEGNPEETVVTIELAERAGRTELRLTHEGFAEAAQRDAHGDGWKGSFEKLARRVA